MTDNNEQSKLSEFPEFGEFANNPNKYGAPTWEQFSKDPQRYIINAKESCKLDMIDNGPQQTRGQVAKTKIYVAGYYCETPEKAESVANSENIDLRSRPRFEFIDIGTGKAEIRAYFEKKKEPRNGLIVPPY